MRSPIVAILWELWRVTRAEIAWKLALPIGAALTVLGLAAAFGPANEPPNTQGVNDEVAALALILIVLPHLIGWLSLAKLNGGQPGFPLYLLYTRPVRTAVIVGLPLTYFAALSWAIYLVSAIVLRVASGLAFPLLPVAVWMAAYTVITLAGAWSTRSRLILLLVMMYAVTKGLGMSMQRLTAVELPGGYDWPPRLWPTLFDFPRSDYGWIALISLAAFGVTVAGVAWQRHGAWIAAPTLGTGKTAIDWTPGNGLWAWLINLFRVPCPTSSATGAQVWADLKSNGFPVLTIGVALASVILLLSAVSGPIDAAWNADPDVSCPIEECFWARATPPLITPMSLLAILSLAGNAFGIRRRQGRASISAFEATQAYGTGQLALLKVLVKSVCVLAALVAIGVSVWLSMPLLGDAVFIQMWEVPLNSRRSVLTAAVKALTGYEQLALAVVAAGAVALWVASWAAVGALRTRYPRRITVAVCLLLLYGVAFVWLAVGVRMNPETASQFHLDVVYGAMRWIAAAAIVFATAYLAWRTLAERLLTVRQAWSVVLLSAAFAAAWLTVLRAAGSSLTAMPASDAVRILSPALLALTASVLAPWSYSRVRHT
jgi:hypothetical protein